MSNAVSFSVYLNKPKICRFCKTNFVKFQEYKWRKTHWASIKGNMKCEKCVKNSEKEQKNEEQHIHSKTHIIK